MSVQKTIATTDHHPIACFSELQRLWFYPTIGVGAAVAAGVPWLTYSCAARQHAGSVELHARSASILPSSHVPCRHLLDPRAVRGDNGCLRNGNGPARTDPCRILYLGRVLCLPPTSSATHTHTRNRSPIKCHRNCRNGREFHWLQGSWS